MKKSASFILLLPFVFYLLIATREFYWDGVSFALDIERAKGNLSSLIRPNHLINNLIGYFAYEVFGEKFRALYIMQALNGLLAGICILLVYLILKEMTQSRYHSICLALLMAFSAAWWRFATDANAYIPSILFLLISYYLLQPSRIPRPLLVGLMHAAAMLFHELAIFFFPAAFAALWKQSRKWSSILCYVGVSFTVTLAFFIGAFRSVPYAGSFWSWITVHSPDAQFTYSLWHNIVISLRGNMKLLFGGRILLVQLDAVTVLGIAGLAVTLGWLIRLRVEIVESLKRMLAQITRRSFYDNYPLLVWIFCYLLFLLFWLPKNTFYRLFYLPALILAIGALGRPWKEKFRHSLALAVMVVFLWNFTFLIYPYSRAGNNEIMSFAIEHQQDWPQGTEIIYSNFHSNLWTISYFNPQASWQWKTEFAEITGSGDTGPAWLEGTAYDTVMEHPGGEEWLSAHIDMSRSLLYRSPLHVFRFYRVLSTGEKRIP